MNDTNVYMRLYDALLGGFGHQGWWPAETPFEVLTGAVLTQNTSWSNVEKAIANLRLAGCLSPAKMVSAGERRLQELIRPSGYWRQKTARLMLIALWVDERCGDDVQMEALTGSDTAGLRKELLGLKGIGPETADSILLYAFGRPVFVVDAYTARVLGRHGLLPEACGYEDIRSEFEENLPCDVELFRDFHAQMVNLGKRFCRRNSPLCGECPLTVVLGMPEIDEVQ